LKVFQEIISNIKFKTEIQTLIFTDENVANFDLWSNMVLNFGEKRILKFFKKKLSPPTGKKDLSIT
jgi:hypothetical protein